MSPHPKLKRRPGRSDRRVCLCLLVAVLVVYNPFAALNGSASCHSYERLASNRATIGASELQHFSPVSHPEVKTEPAVGLRYAEAVPCKREWPLRRDQVEMIPSDPALLGAVWFRPPPAL